MTPIASTCGRLHSEFVRLLFLQDHRETDHCFVASGVQMTNQIVECSTTVTWFSSQLKNKVGLDLTRETTLRITLNIDGTPIISKLHTHP
jgi:hypothetical protein